MKNQAIIDQIQKLYGAPNKAAPVAEVCKPEPTLGDILRKAIEARSSMPSPVRDFDEEAFFKVLPATKPAPLYQKDYSLTAQKELTGGKVNYYLARVDHPQRKEQAPYQAECEDIIHALGMTFDEGCLFKALWRSVNARKGNGKPGLLPEYDAEKMVHYATRILNHARNTNNG